MTAIVHAFHSVGLYGAAALRADFQASDWSKRLAFGTASGALSAVRGTVTGTRTC
ncbi:MAG: hypothetical protein KDK11_04525 [Maritimibacter sp.]|nr:hypothetical protein [Maritimibacter sp.]